MVKPFSWCSSCTLELVHSIGMFLVIVSVQLWKQKLFMCLVFFHSEGTNLWISNKFSGFIFFYVTFIIRFIKVHNCDKLYQLIWILAINWKNSVLLFKILWLKNTYEYKFISGYWHKFLSPHENWWVSMTFINWIDLFSKNEQLQQKQYLTIKKHCGIVVSEFIFQSRYYVHFRANTLGKGMNPLILPAMG